MLFMLQHFYRFAEVYTVILTWITVPLGFFACYLFFQRHYGMFVPVPLTPSAAANVSVSVTPSAAVTDVNMNTDATTTTTTPEGSHGPN